MYFYFVRWTTKTRVSLTGELLLTICLLKVLPAVQQLHIP